MTRDTDANPFETDEFIVVLKLSGRPTFALMSSGGYLLDVRHVPELRWDTIFDRNGLFVHWTHILPDVSRIRKIVIGLPVAKEDDTLAQLRSRSGVGLLYHLTQWLGLPSIVANVDWLDQYKELYACSSARQILDREYPKDVGYERALHDEDLAEAALLAFCTVSNEQWQGIPLERGESIPISTGNSSRTLH